MRRTIRRHAGAAALTVLGIATIVGGIGWAWPGSRDWMIDHPGLGWLVAAAAIVGVIDLWIVTDREIVATEQAQAGPTQALIDQAKTLADKDAEIADLNRRLYPSERDKAQFTAILAQLPWENGTMVWLQTTFSGRRWTAKHLDPLNDFHGEWRDRYFDDLSIQAAFVELYGSINDLTTWMAHEGAGDDDANKGKSTSDDSWTYRIREPHKLDGGLPEFDRLRDRGLTLGGAVHRARREFERVGRLRGL